MPDYHIPPAGLPPQTQLMETRAVFTDAYAIIPGTTVRDITASALPGWDKTRLWIIARPMTGFAETFSHYLMEVSPGGGSDAPEPNPEAQGALFVTGGAGRITVNGNGREIRAGSFVYIPAGAAWSLRAEDTLTFHWVRKRYVAASGIDAPEPIFTSDVEVAPTPMPDTGGVWATTRFVDPADLRHDM
uniref:cupin domain-containing protein n=1 Tax=Palleronia sp. TaxID=1940284 RepID=UPI0035C7F05C